MAEPDAAPDDALLLHVMSVRVLQHVRHALLQRHRAVVLRVARRPQHEVAAVRHLHALLEPLHRRDRRRDAVVRRERRDRRVVHQRERQRLQHLLAQRRRLRVLLHHAHQQRDAALLGELRADRLVRARLQQERHCLRLHGQLVRVDHQLREEGLHVDLADHLRGGRAQQHQDQRQQLARVAGALAQARHHHHHVADVVHAQDGRQLRRLVHQLLQQHRARREDL